MGSNIKEIRFLEDFDKAYELSEVLVICTSIEIMFIQDLIRQKYQKVVDINQSYEIDFFDYKIRMGSDKKRYITFLVVSNIIRFHVVSNPDLKKNYKQILTSVEFVKQYS